MARSAHSESDGSGRFADRQCGGPHAVIELTAALPTDARLVPDPIAIGKFLQESVRDDIHLCAITEGGGVVGRWFGSDIEAACTWAASKNAAGANLHWTVNVVRAGLNKKPAKSDITHARFAQVDIDPPKAGGPLDRAAVRARLDALSISPTFVIDSGGGLQAFWRLDEPNQDLEIVEVINRQLAAELGGDHCHNIDRLMRLPGSVNWPDKRKQARGRVPAVASVATSDTGEAIGVAQLVKAFPPPDGDENRSAPSGVSKGSLLCELGITHLDQPLHRILTDTDPARRSEDLLHAASLMVRRGLSDETILRVLLDPALAISGHPLDQADSGRAAQRAIDRARSDSRSEGARRGNQQGPPGPLPGLCGPEEWEGKFAGPRRFIMLGWIASGSAGLFGGEDGVGKSLLAQQMATCAAAGVPFLGCPIEHVRAIYITCEDDKAELQRRQESINEALGLTMKDLKGWMRCSSLKGEIGNELATSTADGLLTPTTRYEQIRHFALEFGARLVFLDNAAHVFAGNENARHDVAAFLGLLERLSIEIDGAVVLLAHPNKQHSQGSKQGNEYSGSTGWSAHVRNRLFMDWESGDAPNPDGRILRRSKANYASKGEEICFLWYRWAFTRETDLSADTVREMAQASRDSSANLRFLECLAKKTAEGVNVSHSSSAGNYAAKVLSAMPLAKGYSRRDFEGAMQRLLHLGTIKANENVFQYPNRTWAKGLRAVSDFAQSPAQNAAQSVAQERTIDLSCATQLGSEVCTGAHMTGSPYTSYIPGAAPEGPPRPGGQAGSAGDAAQELQPAEWARAVLL